MKQHMISCKKPKFPLLYIILQQAMFKIKQPFHCGTVSVKTIIGFHCYSPAGRAIYNLGNSIADIAR